MSLRCAAMSRTDGKVAIGSLHTRSNWNGVERKIQLGSSPVGCENTDERERREIPFDYAQFKLAQSVFAPDVMLDNSDDR